MKLNSHSYLQEKNMRFLPLVSFQQYVCTSVELNRLKRKILSFSKGGK